MTGARRKARALAFQALYEIDSAGHEMEAVVTRLLAKGGLSEENAAFSRELVSGVIHNKEKIDQNIANFDVTALTNATNMFRYITLSTANYDALLIGWEAQAVQDNVIFNGGNSKYTAGGAAAIARQNLIDNHTWTITDGGTA